MKPISIIVTIVIAVCLIIAAYRFGAAQEKYDQQTKRLDARIDSTLGTYFNPTFLARDYQLDLHDDTVRIYDRHRFVGEYTTNWHNQMDSIILADNE